MATSSSSKIEPKTVGLILLVVIALGLAIWQGSKAISGSGTDVSYKSKVPATPDSARPAGFEAAPAGKPDEKTGGG